MSWVWRRGGDPADQPGSTLVPLSPTARPARSVHLPPAPPNPPPGSSRSNSSADTPTARALQGGGRRGGVLEKGPTSLAGPCEAPASPTGEALHALLPPGRRASGAGPRRPRASRAGLPAADLWVAGGAVAEAGPAAAENPLGDLLQQMDGLLSDVQRHIRG